MQSNKTIILLLISLMFIFLQSGCSPGQKPVEVVIQPPISIERQQSDSVAKRFPESAAQGPTVVESAIELSKKHAKLSEEAAVLRQQNQDLTTRNQQLKDRAVALEAQLQQTQKELTEANDLLIEMRIELNNWKVDILGFRDEMRDAGTAQLEALLKILEILGGEATTESAQSKDTTSSVASSGTPGQTETQ
jgi:predicted RNase H-like nuclease (RuvC/YqgF family)